MNNINSDRQLIAYCSDSLSIRLFLGYDVYDPLPWHSTISRTQGLYGEEVFLHLFKEVLKMCVSKGMVRGISNHTHYSPTDSYVRVSVKPGKARQLNCFGQIVVDDAHHVITGTCSDFADKRDSQCLKQIVELTL